MKIGKSITVGEGVSETRCIAMNRATPVLVVGGRGLQFWDLRRQQHICTLPVSGIISGVALVPDGRYVAFLSGSSDEKRTLQLLDLEQGEGPIELKGHLGGINALATTPCGLIVSGGHDGTVRFWDAQSRTCQKVIGGFDRPINQLAVSPDGSKVYVTKGAVENEVSVIDTETNTVIGSLGFSIANFLRGVAVTPDGSKVYVADGGEFDVVLVIDTATDTVIAKPHLARFARPFGVAATPDGSKVYVTHGRGVSVIDTATNGVIATIPTRFGLSGAAVTPDGSKVYVTGANTVLVIDTASDTVVGSPIPVGSSPFGVAVTPDGSKVYVANALDNTVSVIATATDTVTGPPIPVGRGPLALGKFMQPLPAPTFAGTPGFSNCHGQSVAALAQQFGGLNAAAAALGFPSEKALQTAIRTFCRV